MGDAEWRGTKAVAWIWGRPMVRTPMYNWAGTNALSEKHGMQSQEVHKISSRESGIKTGFTDRIVCKIMVRYKFMLLRLIKALTFDAPTIIFVSCFPVLSENSTLAQPILTADHPWKHGDPAPGNFFHAWQVNQQKRTGGFC